MRSNMVASLLVDPLYMKNEYFLWANDNNRYFFLITSYNQIDRYVFFYFHFMLADLCKCDTLGL